MNSLPLKCSSCNSPIIVGQSVLIKLNIGDGKYRKTTCDINSPTSAKLTFGKACLYISPGYMPFRKFLAILCPSCSIIKDLIE